MQHLQVRVLPYRPHSPQPFSSIPGLGGVFCRKSRLGLQNPRARLATPRLVLDIGKHKVKTFDGKKVCEVGTQELDKLLINKPRSVFLECTGMYHRPITRFLLAHHIKVYELNQYRFKKYREQLRQDVKTDAGDVRAMWEYSHLFSHKEIKSVGNPTETLLRKRRLISETITHWKTFMESCIINQETELVSYIKERVQGLERERGLLELELAKHVPEILVKEYGLVLSALLSYLDPHRFPTSKHWTSYLGFKLRTYESGTIKHKRCMTKRGNAEARRLLYLLAMNRLKKKGWERAFYDRLKGYGKPGKVVMVALMRKLAARYWRDFLGYCC